MYVSTTIVIVSYESTAVVIWSLCADYLAEFFFCAWCCVLLFEALDLTSHRVRQNLVVGYVEDELVVEECMYLGENFVSQKNCFFLEASSLETQNEKIFHKPIALNKTGRS
jgi:hypothetical protein